MKAPFEQWLASGKRPEFAPLGLIKKLEKIRQIRGVKTPFWLSRIY